MVLIAVQWRSVSLSGGTVGIIGATWDSLGVSGGQWDSVGLSGTQWGSLEFSGAQCAMYIHPFLNESNEYWRNN